MCIMPHKRDRADGQLTDRTPELERSRLEELQWQQMDLA
jgi:hypothetical protein